MHSQTERTTSVTEVQSGCIDELLLTPGVFVVTCGTRKTRQNTFVQRTIPSKSVPLFGANGNPVLDANGGYCSTTMGPAVVTIESSRRLGALELDVLTRLTAFGLWRGTEMRRVTRGTLNPALANLRLALLTPDDQPPPADSDDVILAGEVVRDELMALLGKPNCFANWTIVVEAIKGLQNLLVTTNPADGSAHFTRVIQLSFLPGARTPHKTLRFGINRRLTEVLIAGGRVRGLRYVELSLDERRALADPSAEAEAASLLHAQLGLRMFRRNQRPRTWALDDLVELTHGPFRVNGGTKPVRRPDFGDTNVSVISDQAITRWRGHVREGLMLLAQKTESTGGWRADTGTPRSQSVQIWHLPEVARGAADRPRQLSLPDHANGKRLRDNATARG